MIFKPAYTHLCRDKLTDVLPVLPIPESHSICRVIGQVRMEGKTGKFEIKGYEITLLEGLHDERQTPLIVVSCDIHFIVNIMSIKVWN